MKQALKQLLDALDEISKTHAEVSDAANREAMTRAINQGFVLRKPVRFGMLSTEGNCLVREALAAFLAHPDCRRKVTFLLILGKKLSDGGLVRHSAAHERLRSGACGPR